jgi:hypothetical protein
MRKHAVKHDKKNRGREVGENAVSGGVQCKGVVSNGDAENMKKR